MSERDLFIGITKEYVLQAIARIDEEGYYSMRGSKLYDLVWKKSTYPPKYVIALAGFFRNQVFITDEFSGGEESACFEYLRNLGFEILPKEKTKDFKSSKQNSAIQDKYLSNITKMDSPDFFTKKDFEILKQFAGQRLDRSKPEMESAFAYLKETYEKIDYWASEVLHKSFPEGEMTIRKASTNQANKFEEYQWARLYPNEGLMNWKKLAYTLTFSVREDLCVKIDTVSLGDNDPLRKKYFDYRGEFFSSPIVKIFKFEDISDLNWEGLISKSVESIESLHGDYNKLLGILGYNGTTNKTDSNPLNVNRALNTILYGPPGTGKTRELNEIKLQEFTDFGIKKSEEELLHETLLEYPFWQVLGAALNSNGNSMTVTQLVDHAIVKARIKPAIKTKPQNLAWADLQSYADDESTQLAAKYRRSIKLFHKDKEGRWSIAKDKLVELPDIIDQKLLDIAKTKKVSSVISQTEVRRYNFITFHQKYTYEDFIEGIKPVLRKEGPELDVNDDDASHLAFELKKGIFYSSCVEALKLVGYNSFEECYQDTKENRKEKFSSTKENKQQKFALFIDEINRANVSAVFGELITLIEENKRIGEVEEMWIRLPQSNEHFAVPPNLYLIGSMNTADKSIALIDIALRRRFEFEGRYPDYNTISKEASDLLRKINAFIFEKKGSADYLIGHAYFINAKSIESVLKNKVIPLLMEYFMGKLVFVQEAFKGSGWSVVYDRDNYSWKIGKA